MPTVIESNGLTSVVQVGGNYFLYPIGTSSGPQLRMSGAAVTAGQFGLWTPIGAEQVGSGYEVAWQFGTADQFIVWNLDSSGLGALFGLWSAAQSKSCVLEIVNLNPHVQKLVGLTRLDQVLHLVKGLFQ